MDLSDPLNTLHAHCLPPSAATLSWKEKLLYKLFDSPILLTTILSQPPTYIDELNVAITILLSGIILGIIEGGGKLDLG